MTRDHRPTTSLALATFLGLLVSAAAIAAPDTSLPPMSEHDIEKIVQVVAADLSHDGRTAAFIRDVPRRADEENGPAWRHLYLVDLDAPEERPFVVGEERAYSPRFSPDDRFVGFIAKRHGHSHAEVWAIPTGGGEARRLTDHGADVRAFVWLSDGRLAYVAAAPRGKREEALRERGYAPEFFEEDLREQAVWIAPGDPADGPAKGDRLTEGRSVWQLATDPTGPRLFAGASKRPLVDEMYMEQNIYSVEVPAPSEKVTPREFDLVVDVPGKLGTFQVAPDGSRVAYTAAYRRSDHAPSNVYVIDSGGGEPVNRTPPNFEGHAVEVTWWDARTILYLAEEGVWQTWSLIGLEGDAARRRLQFEPGQADLVPRLPVVRRGGRRLLFIADSARHPAELFLSARDGRPTRLSDSNPWLAERRLGRQEIIRYEARDGLLIEGLLIHPVDESAVAAENPEERPPLLVDVHGGPEMAMTNGWLTSYFRPAQVAAGRGFVFFTPNYRGSTGRGTDFAFSSFGDPAGAEFEDVADGIRFLTREEGGPTSPARVGMIGGSYGGYAANWFATRKSELVRAVVPFVGISHLISKRLLTDIPVEDEDVHMGAPVHEQWDLMLERSPIRHATESRTAVLLLHGDSDTRVHPTQSMEMFRALQRAGNPALRLVFYPGEGHGNRLRAYRLDAALRTLAWLEWYVQDLRPLDGPLPPLDLSAHYGLELPDAPALVQEN